MTLQADRRQKQSMHVHQAQLAVSAASTAASGAGAYSERAADAAARAATFATDNWGDARALRIPRSMALCSS